MRVIARIYIPPERGSHAIKEGVMARLMQDAADRWKPEAMYFTTLDGHRTALMVFDLPDESDMMPFAEPFRLKLDAEVQLAPVMNREDLQRGFGKTG